MPDREGSTRPSKRQARHWMIRELQAERGSYEDASGCCFNTLLAENCASALGLYIDEIDYEIPEWVFEESLAASAFVGGFNE